MNEWMDGCMHASENTSINILFKHSNLEILHVEGCCEPLPLGHILEEYCDTPLLSKAPETLREVRLP
jgi:hypothetical protein